MPETVTYLEQLTQLKLAEQFEPFVIATKNGENVIVYERMLFATDGKRVTVLDKNDRGSRFPISDILKIRTIRELMQ